LDSVLNLYKYLCGHAEADGYLGSAHLNGYRSLTKSGMDLGDSRSWSNTQSCKAIDYAVSAIDLRNSSAFTRPQVVKTLYLQRSTSL